MLSSYNQIWKIFIKAQDRDKKTIQVVMAVTTCRRKDLDSTKPLQKPQASPRGEEESSPHKDTFLNMDHREEWEMIHPSLAKFWATKTSLN